jgi:hypothetical protein
MQFIRRIANPGFNYNTPGIRYQPIPLSDEASLAFHFCLTNPNVSTPSTVLENLLSNSIFWKVAPSGTTPGTAYTSTPYDPSSAAQWYADSFAYSTSADNLTLPARALLVTRNPVSNYIPQVYNNNGGTASSYDPLLPNYMLPYCSGQTIPVTAPHYKGTWSSSATYNMNDIVTCSPSSGYAPPLGTTYISLANSNTGNNPTTTLATWAIQPWTLNAAKANVNTATFRELFRAFWCVMAGNPSNATPFGYYTTANAPPSIYGDTGPVTGNSNPQHEFRSPLRDPINVTPAAATQLDPPPGAPVAFPQINSTGGTTNTNTMLLRAALAAVNTLGLRDNTQNIISKTFVTNTAYVPSVSTATGTPVEIRVFSNAPQPFITEVYVDNYNGAPPTAAGSVQPNSSGYIAIELFNPYSVPLVLNNWQLAYINRPTVASVYPNLTLTSVSELPTITIPPAGYALLENYNAPGSATTQPSTQPSATTSDANYRSTNSGILPAVGALQGSASTTQPSTTQPSGVNVVDVYVQGLSVVYGGSLGASSTNANAAGSNGGELVLLRPRRYDGTYTNYSDPANPSGGESFNESSVTPASSTAPNLYDLVPVDSYDFTGFPAAPTTGTGWTAWSYLRAKGSGNSFDATYPGIYDAGKTVLAVPAPRQTGTFPETMSPTTALGYPNTAGNGGGGISWPTYNTPAFFQTVTSSYTYYENNYRSTNPPPPPPVQLYTTALGNAASDVMHFPNSTVSPQHPAGTAALGTPYTYPLGGFARNGDMLDIPFIGAYRIRQVSTISLTPQNFLEMNSLPSDCQSAAVDDELSASTMTPAQNIGRFVPMAATYEYITVIQTGKYPNGTAATLPLPDYYAWTRNLFNYLTVQSSSDAYLPNFDPNLSSSNYTGTPSFAYPPYNKSGAAQAWPSPTLTADATAADQTAQDKVGVEGLININTASWKVLSMLPFVPNNPAVDRLIARNIVSYRLAHGPFTSIFDLNQVTGFQNGTGAAGAPTAATSATGLLSPADPNFESATASPSGTATGITEDYQWDCLTLSRISNLITTRSDTFTIYIEVQGWQNVGLPTAASPTLAQPMITRRYAFIVDRSAINGDPNSRFLKTVTVPND